MRQYIFDVLGLFGFGAISCGIFLEFGLPVMLMASGGMILFASLLAARAKARRTGGSS